MLLTASFPADRPVAERPRPPRVAVASVGPAVLALPVPAPGEREAGLARLARVPGVATAGKRKGGRKALSYLQYSGPPVI